MGWHLTEEITYGENGELVTNGTWTYKPPSSEDIPIDFQVHLLKNAPNPAGILRSKVRNPERCSEFQNVVRCTVYVQMTVWLSIWSFDNCYWVACISARHRVPRFSRFLLYGQASGEPPCVLAASIVFALQHAVNEARKEMNSVRESS